MSVLIVNNSRTNDPTWVSGIYDAVYAHGVPSLNIHISEFDEHTSNLFDKIIFSGSAYGESSWGYLPKYRRIWNPYQPVLGICAGHQLIGQAFGAIQIEDDEEEIGFRHIHVTKMDDIFTGISDKFVARQMHRYSITAPPDFQILATSKDCINQVMKHAELPIYTTQFHPEIMPTGIINNFLDIK